MDKVAPGRVRLQVPRFPPISIITLMLPVSVQPSTFDAL